ncbi:MAG: hypothetical protein IPO27_16395 [Bacteroidetes bacterium]|nr:hypothetical protein [Bacteroidota bacterium]
MNAVTEQTPNKGQNFGLTPDEFNEHLKELLSGNELLFEIIFKTHFEKCRSFLVRKLGAYDDVAYDITLETLIKFRKNLMAGKIKYGNMVALFTIDARNNYLRQSKKENKYDHVPIESHEHDLIDDTDSQNLDMEMVQNLKRALLNLGNDCFELLNGHYYLGLALRTIADSRFQRGEEKFINESSVKTKVAECRKS